MAETVLRWTLVAASIACAIGYRYAVRRLFRADGRWPRGAVVILVVGMATGIAQTVLLAVVPVDLVRGCIALGLFALSLALFWSAVAATRARPLTIVFSGDVPKHLVERGPYRFVRNPFYVSYLLCYLAGLVGTGSWPLAVPVVALAAAFAVAARHEERKFLGSPLAADYRAYMRRTGRFLPRVGVSRSGVQP